MNLHVCTYKCLKQTCVQQRQARSFWVDSFSPKIITVKLFSVITAVFVAVFEVRSSQTATLLGRFVNCVICRVHNKEHVETRFPLRIPPAGAVQLWSDLGCDDGFRTPNAAAHYCATAFYSPTKEKAT